MKTPTIRLATPLTCAILLWSSAAYTQQFFKGADKDKGSDSSLSVLKNFGTMTHLPEDCSAPWDFPTWFYLYPGEMESACPKDSTLLVFEGEVQHREIYQHNDNSQLTSAVFQSLFPTGWRNGGRSQFSYDTEGRLTQESSETWYMNDWRDDYVSNRTYNESGQPSSITVLNRVDDALQNDSRLLFQYDDENRLSQLIEQGHSEGEWVDYRYHEYAYNPSGCLVSQEVAELEQDTLIPYNRKLFSHDSLSRITSLTEEVFGEDSLWHPYWQSQYEYGSNPSSVNLTLKQWDDSLWTDYQHTEIIFDEDGNILSELISYTSGSVMFPRYLVTYEHDEDGNMTSKKSQENSEYPIVDWTNDEWFQAEFDEHGNRTLKSLAFGNEHEWIHYEDAFSYFDCSALDIEERSVPDELTVFPNPTSSGFHLQLERGALQSVVLTDALGRTVISQPISGRTAYIATDGLAPGLYVATVRTDAGMVHRRVVVE